jgi:hypothetical protein
LAGHALAVTCALATLTIGAALPAWKVIEDTPNSVAISCPPIRQRPLWRLLQQAPWLVDEARQAGDLTLALDFYRRDLVRLALLMGLAGVNGGLAYYFTRLRREAVRVGYGGLRQARAGPPPSRPSW